MSTTIEKQRIANLTMLDLLDELSSKPQKYLHVYDLQKRLQDAEIRDLLLKVAKAPSTPASDAPALVLEAQEILATGWDASTLYNPDNAIGLLQTIVQDEMDEEDLSERQHRFMLSIRSHYKSWVKSSSRHRSSN